MKNYEVMNMKSIARELNNRKYTDYFYRLSLIAKSRFKWNNLPNGISEKWIERYLFTDGRCVFFKDEEKGFMVCKCNGKGPVNNYDEPVSVRPYGTNYQGKELVNNKECVVIKNNDDEIPTTYTIQLYAHDLANISRTIDVNINGQKTPYMIKCTDKQQNSVKAAYNKVKDNEPVIYVDKQMDTGAFEVIPTIAPIVFDKLQIQKHEIFNECMTFLGINNANMNKRERLVTNEVEANNEQIEMSAQVMLSTRQEACEKINELFGLTGDKAISVELKTISNEEYETIKGGVVNDEG